jgi:hypothetical protein
MPSTASFLFFLTAPGAIIDAARPVPLLTRWSACCICTIALSRNAAMQKAHNLTSQKIHVFPMVRAIFEHLVKRLLPFATKRRSMQKL